MFSERTSVGLDVHARSIAAAAIDTLTGEFFKATLVPQPEVVIDWVRGLPGPAAVTYEAGPTGFGLARALWAAPRHAGRDRVDARRLAEQARDGFRATGKAEAAEVEARLHRIDSGAADAESSKARAR